MRNNSYCSLLSQGKKMVLLPLLFLVCLILAFSFTSCTDEDDDDDIDIRLEVDWLNINGNDLLRPDQEVIKNRIVKAFEDHGYTVEIQVSNAIPHATGQLALGPTTSRTFYDLFGPDTEYGQLKAAHKSNGDDWHYCIIAWQFYFSDQQSVIQASGLAELPGKNFVLAGAFYTPPTQHYQNYMSNTLMHEWGHNLGLRHGGFEDHNFKPNYNSIMNYRYQLDGHDTNCDAWGEGRGNISGGTGDFSSGSNINLDETAIYEPFGVCGDVGIDWTGDGYIDPDTNYYGNLDINTQTGQPYDANLTVLQDNNDWANLNTSGAKSYGLHGEYSICDNIHPDADPHMSFKDWWVKHGDKF